MGITWQQIRKAGSSNTFYPGNKNEIERYINIFNTDLDVIKRKDLLNVAPRAIISPHAGYVYSGFTANAAHKTLSNAKPATIVIIGPSHYVYINGISAAFTKHYETPLGNLETDTELLEKLHNKFDFHFDQTAHLKEHSTETQMPFIAHYNPQAKIVELIYGNTTEDILSSIIDEILKQENSAVVISSDLSHFHSLETAQLLDNVCITAFENKDLNTFDNGCEACGITGIKAVTTVAKNRDFKTAILDYRTSADFSNNISSVVGYMSGVVW